MQDRSGPGKTREELQDELALLRERLARLEAGADQAALDGAGPAQTREIAGFGHWEYDPATTKGEWSDSLYRMFGFEPGEVAVDYAFLLDHIHPDDREAVMREVEESLAARDFYDGEYRIVTRDGRIKYARSRSEIRRSPDGVPTWMGGTFQDVTEARRAEEALRASEDRFRSMFENAPLAYQSLDENGFFLDVNQKWQDTLGYSKDEVMGKWFGDFLDPAWVGDFDRNFPMFKEACLIDRVEFEMVRKDGSTLRVRFSGRVQQDAQGRFLRTHCIFSDVTEETRRRERLAKESSVNLAQAEIARALTLPDSDIKDVSTVVLDCARRLTGSAHGYVSSIDAATRGNVGHTLTAMLNAEVCGVAGGGITFPAGPRGYGGLWGWSLNTKEPFFTNAPNEHPASIGLPAGHAPLEAFLSVPALYEGELFGQIALANPGREYAEADVEAIRPLADLFAVAVYRVRSREKLVAAMEKAEAANKAKSAFLANMSHELRTPLNHIMGCMQLLETTPLDEEQREYALLSRQACDNLTRLLSDILDLARMEAGRLSLIAAPFALREAIDPVRGIYGDIALRKGLALDINVDPALPEKLVGDAARLRQILLNLVGNAVKFTEDGRVAVALSALSPMAPGTCRLFVEVEDTGIGIPHDMLLTVFEPFTQVEDDYTRRYQGAGLGLRIVKRMLELMGGTLCLSSEVGAGTRLAFSLTFALPVVSRRSRGALDDVEENATGRVLLVEDDLMTAKVISGFLAKLGYDCEWAEDGQKGLDALAVGGFDAVLMDIQMPVKSGMDAVRDIRTNPEFQAFANLPVIAMTAYAMRGDREKFLDAGMDGYIAKPVDMKKLGELLARLIAWRRDAGQASV